MTRSDPQSWLALLPPPLPLPRCLVIASCPGVPDSVTLNGATNPSFSGPRHKHCDGAVRCTAVVNTRFLLNASNVSLKFQPAS